MSWSYLKNLPTPVRWMIHPALFLSVGLHLLLLLLPILPDRTSREAQTDSEDTEVSLTSLPIAPQPQPSASTPSPLPAAKPSVASSPAAPILTPAAPITPQRSVPPVSQSSPSASATPTPASVQPSAQPSALPSPTISPLPPPQNRIVAPFASFPHMADAQPGCFNQSAGDCQQVSGNFRQVSQALRDQLNSQGYDVKQRDDLEETGRQVYEVTKDGNTRFLSVISSDLAGTAYILAAEPVTQADVEQIGTVQTDLQTRLSNLANSSTVTSAQFVYPEFFFTGTQLRPEINGQPYLFNGTIPTQLADRLINELQTGGFQASQVGEYGGGPVYEVGRKAFWGYVNLLPTQDGTGTIAVLWQRLPQ